MSESELLPLEAALLSILGAALLWPLEAALLMPLEDITTASLIKVAERS